SMTALGSLMRPMTLISETVFPDPDSPTTPTISRSPMLNETLSTARTGPRSVRKETERPFTSSSVVPTSGKAYPGIQGRIDEINDGIGANDEERGIDHGRHDHRQVEILQRIISELAHPLQAEDNLCQQRTAAHQRAEVEAEQGNKGDQRCAQ